MKDRTLMLQKTAVRFAKTGPAVYHSHHDMIRFWERAVRRAALPVRLTQGFNPHARMVFPHALGVGIASRCEEVELELHAAVPVEEVADRLRRAGGGVLEILGASALPPVKKTRLLVESAYGISGWPEEALPALAAACAALAARGEILVDRGAPGEKRRMDIRPYLLRVEYSPAERVVRARLRHTPGGAARADEVARLVAEAAGADARDLSIEKTGMVLE